MNFHQMRLKKKPFYDMISGKKTFEIRLNDEKRQKVKIGDYILFEPYEKSLTGVLTTRVKRILNFTSFRDVVENIPPENFSLSKGKNSEDLLTESSFYPLEKEEKYGYAVFELLIISMTG